MKSEKYRNTIDRIQPSAQLRERTRQQMHAAQSHCATLRSTRRIPGKLVALAASLVLVIGLAAAVLLRPTHAYIRTELSADRHIETVELDNGSLHFAELTASFVNPPALGGLPTLRESWTLGQLQDYTGVAVRTAGLEALTLQESKITAYYSASRELQAVVGTLHYTGKKGASVRLTVSTNAPPQPAGMPAGGSEIGSVSLGVAYSEHNDTYYAAAQPDLNYFIAFENMPQESVVAILYELFKD